MNQEINTSKLRIYCLTFAILIGLIYSYSARFSITADGISYVDMADEFLHKDYKALVNGIWSPLYPFLISLGFFFFKPDSYNEFPVVHIVNFLIYLFALFSFDFLLSSLLRFNEKSNSKEKTSDLFFVPDWALTSIGYSLFILSSLNIMGVWGADPDICFSAFIYLSIGILLRISSGENTVLNFILFGLSVGFGYLAKAPMLPISLLMTVLLYHSCRSDKNILFKIAMSAFIFLLIASPYIVELSKYKKHFTVGESGRLNYAWYVNNVPLFCHWQGDVKNKLTHPTKKILANPDIYEFSEPLFGTYPPWIDPSYWYDGVTVRFDFIRQISAISANGQILYELLLKLLGFLIAGILILLSIADKKLFFKYKLLLFPSVFAFIMFSLVHLEPRYIGAFIPVLFVGLFSVPAFIKNEKVEKAVNKILIVMLFMLMITIGVVDGREISSWLRNGNEHIEWKTVSELNKIGISHGDKVGTIGYSVPYLPYWARLAKVKIVAEITEKDSNEFYKLNNEEKDKIMDAFKHCGVKAVVLKKPLYYSNLTDWKKISDSNIYVYLFK